MLNLASDNVVGASKPVLEALIAANDGAENSYGSDQFSTRAEEMLAEIFEHEVKVFLVSTGTGANALALSALTPPWGAIFCHEESHIIDDECGAPEMFTDGAKLVGIAGVAGKITPEALERTLTRYPKGAIKAVQPAALSISQVTEAGTLYSLDEIATLGATAKKHGIFYHLDGARFGNALIGLGCTAAEMTWKSGVNVVSFGATKNGCLACEAVIFFDPKQAETFAFRRKRSGHTVSKGRLLGAQMVGYLEGNHWIDNARHANAMAQKLANGLVTTPGAHLPWPTEANEVFAILPAKVHTALAKADIKAAPWASLSLPPNIHVREGEAFWRFVTSFATRTEDIDHVIAVAHGA